MAAEETPVAAAVAARVRAAGPAPEAVLLAVVGEDSAEVAAPDLLQDPGRR